MTRDEALLATHACCPVRVLACLHGAGGYRHVLHGTRVLCLPPGRRLPAGARLCLSQAVLEATSPPPGRGAVPTPGEPGKGW